MPQIKKKKIQVVSKKNKSTNKKETTEQLLYYGQKKERKRRGFNVEKLYCSHFFFSPKAKTIGINHFCWQTRVTD